MVRLFSCFSSKSTKVVQCSQNEAILSRPRPAFHTKATLYQETIQTHEVRMAELEHSESQHVHTIGDLRATLGEREAQLHDTARELDACRSKATEDQQIIDCCVREIRELEHQARENAGVIRDLRRQVEQCERRKQEDGKAINEYQCQHDALEHREDQHVHVVGDLHTTLGEREAQLRDTTRELDACRCKAAEDQQIINSCAQKIEELEHQARENAEVIEDLRHQVENCERRKQEDDKVISDYKSQIEEYESYAPTIKALLAMKPIVDRLLANGISCSHDSSDPLCDFPTLHADLRELQARLATAVHGVAPYTNPTPSPLEKEFTAERDRAAAARGWRMVDVEHVPTKPRVGNASIFLTNRDFSRLLLVHSRKPPKFGPVAWELPGGKVEEGETPRQAALRELTQEAGIEGDAVEVIGCCGVPKHRMLIYVCVPRGGYLTLDPRDEYHETDGAWHFPLSRTNDDGLPRLTYEKDLDHYLYSWIAQSMLQGGVQKGASRS